MLTSFILWVALRMISGQPSSATQPRIRLLGFLHTQLGSTKTDEEGSSIRTGNTSLRASRDSAPPSTGCRMTKVLWIHTGRMGKDSKVYSIPLPCNTAVIAICPTQFFQLRQSSP
ncbi:hypothetical protein FB45DRAFT_236650 [Roridomyces roridus]|uniref:Secreted protein n=1 Tax=Roridomyces roridus TaxID=1738132 RepID=A0AAD7BBX6_9AGAR|nr:hypothetical protein FB45DRAFT_236650 [Roridomyces roridus]